MGEILHIDSQQKNHPELLNRTYLNLETQEKNLLKPPNLFEPSSENACTCILKMLQCVLQYVCTYVPCGEEINSSCR